MPCANIIGSNKFMSRCMLTFLTAGLFLLPATPARSQELDEDELDFASLSIEELMNIEVTSVAGVGQSWFKTPAAMYVITGDDIRRSGHQSLAEVLRLVPGVQVGRINSNQWSVGIRGINSRFTPNLLVLVDGRSVYDPLFSGVFWNAQDLILDDLGRIEVIRGPGATLWGANAVNGVINITTKNAKDTQGGYLKTLIGTEERTITAMRYGGQINENTHYRVWTKYANRDSFENIAGNDRPDDWDLAQGGFRLDIDGADNTTVTLDSRIFDSGRIGEGVKFAIPPGPLTGSVKNDDGHIGGGHILMRVHQESAENQDWTFQAYYDRFNFTDSSGLKINRDTIDFDFRQHWIANDQHEMVWGLAFRYWDDRTRGGQALSVNPQSKDFYKYSAFIQDTVTLEPETLFLIIGSKVEYNDFTGFEVQPSGRLSWTPDDQQTLWAAISRPVRTPSRLADGIVRTVDFFLPSQLLGDPELQASNLTAYELGYRVRVTEELSFDTAVFYFEYDDLISFPSGGVGFLTNAGEAESYGFEIAATWNPTDNLQVTASYSFIQVQLHGLILQGSEGDAPEQQFQIRSSWDITNDLALNSALYYVDNTPNQNAEAYFRLDLGMTWRPSENLELAIWGQNLLDPSHLEFDESFTQSAPTEIERGVFIQTTIKF